MPGSGKSAVGRRLATRLDIAFVDADEEIERAAGKPIMDIFKDHGEPYFREGERKVIARLLAAGPQVLATGGGALMVAETRDNIRRSGISIWLKAELARAHAARAQEQQPSAAGEGPRGRHARADGGALSRSTPPPTSPWKAATCRTIPWSGEIIEALAKPRLRPRRPSRNARAAGRGAMSAGTAAARKRRGRATIPVALGSRSYDVLIGPGLMARTRRS